MLFGICPCTSGTTKDLTHACNHINQSYGNCQTLLRQISKSSQRTKAETTWIYEKILFST